MCIVLFHFLLFYFKFLSWRISSTITIDDGYDPDDADDDDDDDDDDADDNDNDDDDGLDDDEVRVTVRISTLRSFERLPWGIGLEFKVRVRVIRP